MTSSGEGNEDQELSLEIFCSWSQCEEDRVLFEKLTKNLAALSGVKVRHSDEISPGDDREKTLKEWEKSAHIILILLSVDFLASDECE